MDVRELRTMTSKSNNPDECRSAPKNVSVTSRCILAVVLSPTRTQYVQADGMPSSAISSGALIPWSSSGGGGGTGLQPSTGPQSSTTTGVGTPALVDSQVVAKRDNNNQAADRGGGSSNPVASAITYNGGRDIWEEFRFRNKTCYWNPALAESIKNLEYMGFVHPCTILVSGPDLHLDNLRMAWGRRVLKAPANYSIDSIGDVNGIEMQIIPQTQFIPLPEALCLIIMDLNNNRIVATLETVQEKLQQCYKDMEVPSENLIYNTLANLIQEGKVFHTGSGYFVVTPDTYRVPIGDKSGSFTVPWSPYKPLYIPMIPTPKTQVRSISCQTSSSAQDGKKSSSKTKPQRSQSVRASRNRYRKSTGEHIRRSASLKFKSDKTLGSTKDINLKSSNLNQDKNKGEKTTLFGKLFGRYKKKASPSKEVEYATFSAQFPPPEWQWYQQQLEKQRRTEKWISEQQVTKSNTWHYLYTVHDPNATLSKDNPAGVPVKIKSATLPPVVSLPPLSSEQAYPDQPGLKETPQHSSKHAKDHDMQGLTNRWSVIDDSPCYETLPNETPSKHRSQHTSCLDGQANESSKHRSSQHKCLKKNSSKTNSPRTTHSAHACTEHAQEVVLKVNKQRKKVERYACCDDYTGNDISIEYKGKLPNKYSMYAFSRDSGVNCIGLNVEDLKVNLSQNVSSKHDVEPVRISKRLHRVYRKRSAHKHRHHSKKGVRNSLYDSNENCAVDIPTAKIAEEFPEACSYLESSTLFEHNHHHHHHHHHTSTSCPVCGKEVGVAGNSTQQPRVGPGESSEQSFNTVVPNATHECPVENLVHETRELNLRESSRSHEPTPDSTGQHRRQKKRHSVHAANRSASAENTRDGWQVTAGDPHESPLLNNQQMPAHKSDNSHGTPRPRSYAARNSQGNNSKDNDGTPRQSNSRGRYNDDFQVVGVV